MKPSRNIALNLIFALFILAYREVCCQEDADLAVDVSAFSPPHPCETSPCAPGCNGSMCAPQPAIIGGTEARAGEFPFMVSLQIAGSHKCGGTLISDRHVLTAAHCVDNVRSAASLKIGFGLHDLRHISKKNLISVKRIMKHKGYDEHTHLHDIAVLELAFAVPRASERMAKAVNLPTKNQNPSPGTNLTAAGWGMVNGITQVPSKVLLKARLPVMSIERCSQKLSGRSIPISQICTENGHGGTCQGDSGGPLVNKRKDGKFYLVGLTSYGLIYCRPNSADVFTRVSQYHDWILAQMRSGNNARSVFAVRTLEQTDSTETEPRAIENEYN